MIVVTYNGKDYDLTLVYKYLITGNMEYSNNIILLFI